MSLKIETFTVTSFQQNARLLTDTQSNEAVLVDVGGKGQELLAYVQAQGLKLKEIWLTHGHYDHIYAVGDVLEKEKVAVKGPHQDDAFFIEALQQGLPLLGFPPGKVFNPTYLKEGRNLNVGSYFFTVFHIPGHSPGHIVFYSEKAGVLLSGDVLFYETIGHTDLPGGDATTLIKNIKEKLFTLPDTTQVLPGHGPATTIGHEKLNNPFIR